MHQVHTDEFLNLETLVSFVGCYRNGQSLKKNNFTKFYIVLFLYTEMHT